MIEQDNYLLYKILNYFFFNQGVLTDTYFNKNVLKEVLSLLPPKILNNLPATLAVSTFLMRYWYFGNIFTHFNASQLSIKQLSSLLSSFLSFKFQSLESHYLGKSE